MCLGRPGEVTLQFIGNDHVASAQILEPSITKMHFRVNKSFRLDYENKQLQCTLPDEFFVIMLRIFYLFGQCDINDDMMIIKYKG